MTKKNNKTPSSSLIVTQANKLVEARYNLSLGEQRLILTMISRIQPEDEDFKPYRISVNELSVFLGVDKNSIYRECKKTTENLLKRVLSIQEPDGLLQVGWVSSAKYIDGTGMVNLSFDPLLKPYLLQLKSNFTSCKLEMLLSFKSQYTMRIYTLLKQYEKLKKRKIELDQLRQVLGIPHDQYQEYKNFKSRILLSTQKELKAKADIFFEFEETKDGRKVGAILFQIFTQKIPEKSPPEQPPLPEPTPVSQSPVRFANLNAQKTPTNDDLIFLVPTQHQTRKTVKSALIEFESKHGFDYVKRNILYTNAKSGKSYAGFLANALKNDWGHDWQLDQQQTAAPKKKVPEVWERQGFKTKKEYDDFMFNKQMEKYNKTLNQPKV